MLYEDKDYENADLAHTDFTNAVFIRCNFTNADLSDANLTGSYFYDCTLIDAKLCNALFHNTIVYDVDFTAADFTEASFANFSFTRCITANAKFSNDIACLPKIDGKTLLKQVATIVLADESRLNMRCWHQSCGTVHCLAGWVYKLTESARPISHFWDEQSLFTYLYPELPLSFLYEENSVAIEFLRNQLT
jgi:hypothetical protein